jgi:GntR family transcriptional regulator / MocR family aminotransferase
MRISIDHQSEVPLYRQIESYIRKSILSGSLEPETRLPARRQLAQSLGVNRITVEAAYGELEADGLIYSKVGSGTYVLSPPKLPPLPGKKTGEPWPLWQRELSNQINDRQADLPQDLKALSGHADLINLAHGSGDCHNFPVEDFRKIIQSVIRRDGVVALDYGNRQGYPDLRSTIVHVLASQGIQTSVDQILITSGSQQALSLVASLLLKAGDVVLVEQPTYNVALLNLRHLGVRIIGLPMDEKGMVVDALENLLQQHHLKLIYTIPNFHNPTGACLDLPRRRQLINLADRYNIPILEDDYVGDLRYEGRAQPALKALDPGGHVIYISTFSKMVMPGLRIGFVVAEGPVYKSLAYIKYTFDLATSNLLQRTIEAYVTVGRYQAHLRRSCQIYRKRRDAMLQSIERHLPEETKVQPPQGGLFIWLRLPDGISSHKLLPYAYQEGVAFSAGGKFFIDELDGEPYLRINFAAVQLDRIDEAIRRLRNAIQRYQC